MEGRRIYYNMFKYSKSIIWHISQKSLSGFQFFNITYGNENINEWGRHKIRQGKDLKEDGCLLELYTMLLFFISITTSFIEGMLWWSNHLIVTFSKLKTEIGWFLLVENIPSPKLRPFDTVSKLLNEVLRYLMNSVTSKVNQSSFEIFHLVDTWRYQSLVILFFSSVLTSI